MKKLFAVLAALMLVVGLAGQAMAAFENGDIIQVIKNTTTTDEWAFSYDFTGAGDYTFTVNEADFGGSFADLEITYFVLDTTAQDIYLSNGGVSGNRKWSTASGAATNVLNYYTSIAVDNYADSDQAVATSYYSLLDKSGNFTGLFGGFLTTDSGDVWSDLSGVEGADVVQMLAFFDAPNSVATGADAGTITTTVNAVPVPAAVWLLGSGLLGLIGIRRRNA